MSHLHAPDGVLPLWLWLLGWAVTLAAVTIASRIARRADIRRRLPLLSIVAAFMLVAMSAEVVPLAYHVNLTVIGGVLLGPALSVIATFIVELMLALLGHGGVTVIGVNTIVLSAEMIAGSLLFRWFVRVLGRRRLRPAAFGATVLGLALSTSLLVGVVALAATSLPAKEEDVARAEAHAGHADEHIDLSPGRFAATVYTLGPVGWIAEALLTAWVLGYVDRVRPGLLWSAVPDGGARRLPGDENRTA